MLRMCSWVSIGMLLAVAAVVQAQATRPGAGKPAAKAPSAADRIDAELKAKEPERRAAALEDFRELLAQKPEEAVTALAKRYLKPLQEGERWEEIVAVGQEAILAMPSFTSDVQTIQFARVRALLKLGRADEALSQAKGLYNVCTMGATREALLLLAECLNAAKKDDGATVERLSQEQMAGAEFAAAGSGQQAAGSEGAGGGQQAAGSEAGTTQPAVGPASAGDASPRDPANGRKSAVLESVKVDPAPYAAAIEAAQAEDYRSLVAKGNLLLLSDRTDEAVKVFERAYAVADKKDLVGASENIARAMKAQDGTIGRANAWVLSLRPTKQP